MPIMYNECDYKVKNIAYEEQEEINQDSTHYTMRDRFPVEYVPKLFEIKERLKLTTKEMAKRIGVREQALYMCMKKGVIPVYRNFLLINSFIKDNEE